MPETHAQDRDPVAEWLHVIDGESGILWNSGPGRDHQAIRGELLERLLRTEDVVANHDWIDPSVGLVWGWSKCPSLSVSLFSAASPPSGPTSRISGFGSQASRTRFLSIRIAV